MSALKGRIKVGTRFVGNVNGVEFEVITIQPVRANVGCVDCCVTVKVCGTGVLFTHGLKMLEHCDITILEV